MLDKSTVLQELFTSITEQAMQFFMPYPLVGLQSLPLQELELLLLLIEALP